MIKEINKGFTKQLETLLYYLRTSLDEKDVKDEDKFLDEKKLYFMLKQNHSISQNNYKISKEGISLILSQYPQLVTSDMINWRKKTKLIPVNYSAFFRYYSLEDICKAYDIDKRDLERVISKDTPILETGGNKYISLISWLDLLGKYADKMENTNAELIDSIEQNEKGFCEKNNIFLSKKIFDIGSSETYKKKIIKDFYECLVLDGYETFSSDSGELCNENYKKLLEEIEKEKNAFDVQNHKSESIDKDVFEETMIEKLLVPPQLSSSSIIKVYSSQAKERLLTLKQEQDLFMFMHKNIEDYCAKFVKKPTIASLVIRLIGMEKSKIASFYFPTTFENYCNKFLDKYNKMFLKLVNLIPNKNYNYSNDKKIKSPEFIKKIKQRDYAIKSFFSRNSITYIFVKESYDILKRIYEGKYNLSRENKFVKKFELTDLKGSKKLEKMLASLKKPQDNIDKTIQTLVCYNIGLVAKYALKSKNRCLEIEDKVQEGVTGLLKAIRLYDYKRGFKFSSYGINWIKQSIEGANLKIDSKLRLPKSTVQDLRKIERISDYYLQEKRRMPSLEELCEKSGFSREKVKRLLSCVKNVFSIDVPVGDIESVSDFIVDDSIDIEEEVYRNQLKSIFEKVLLFLEKDERTLIQLRYGLGKGEALSLRQIGKKLRLSAERVRQKEMKILYKLRRTLKLKNYFK